MLFLFLYGIANSNLITTAICFQRKIPLKNYLYCLSGLDHETKHNAAFKFIDGIYATNGYFTHGKSLIERAQAGAGVAQVNTNFGLNLNPAQLESESVKQNSLLQNKKCCLLF